MTNFNFKTDGDDSSDEETCAEINSYFDATKIYNAYRTSPDNPNTNQNSFLSFILAQEIEHLPGVNEKYYAKKKALGTHSVNVDDETLAQWIHNSLYDAMLQALNLNYKPIIAEKIADKVRLLNTKEITNITATLMADIRLFFKQTHFDNTIPQLESILNPFIEGILKTLKKDISNEDIIENNIKFSIQDLLNNQYLTKSIIDHIKILLNKNDLIDNNKLMYQGHDERRNKIDALIKIEPNWGYQQIYKALRDIKRTSIDTILEQNKTIFCEFMLNAWLLDNKQLPKQKSTSMFNIIRTFPYKSRSIFQVRAPDLYDMAPALWDNYLPLDLGLLQKQWETEFIKNFFIHLPTIININRQNLNITIERPLLPEQYTFVANNIYEYLACLRLYYRDIKRRVRQIEDDHSPLFNGEKLNRSWQFGAIPQQATESLSISAYGAITQLVPNLNSYEKITEDIKEKIKIINKLLTKQNNPEINENLIATWILQLIKFPTDFTFVDANNHPLPLTIGVKKDLTKFLINLMYLILGCEVIRNPAALISNLLILEKISAEKLAWNTALNKKKEKTDAGIKRLKHIQYGGGDMPMSMGGYKNTGDDKKQQGGKPVLAARSLQRGYATFSPYTYFYPGPLSEKSENTKELKRREHVVINDNLSQQQKEEPAAAKTTIIRTKIHEKLGL